MRLLRAFTVAALAVAMLPAQDKIAAGVYKGTYTGAGGAGDIHLALKTDGKGGFIAEVGFTIGGEEVPAKITSLKVDGAKIEMVYDFDLQGARLQSAIQGTLSGKTLAGTYRTTADGATVDEGTWKTQIQ